MAFAISEASTEVLKIKAQTSDQEALSFLARFPKNTLGEFSIPKEEAQEAIKFLARKGKLLWKERSLFVDPFTRADFFYSALFDDQGVLHLEGILQVGTKEKKISACAFLFPSPFPLVICEGTLYFFKERIDKRWLDLTYPIFHPLPKREQEEFYEQFKEGMPPRAPEVRWKNGPPAAPPTAVLPFLVLKERTGAFADLWFDYGERGSVAAHVMPLASWRKKELESSWEKDLLETDFKNKIVGNSHYFCPMDKVAKSLTFLLEIGWKIIDFQGRRLFKSTGEHLSLKMDKEAILVQGKYKYGEHEADLKDVVGAFNRREHFLALNEKAVALIDPLPMQERWEGLHAEEMTSAGVAVKKSRFALLEPFFEESSISREEEIEALRSKLKSAAEIVPTSLGAGFVGTLYPYQQQGVDWLSFLYREGFHGLLADEMGLGKTVQLLAFLSTLEKGPILIVAPTSLLFHWRRECEKFLPSTPLYLHTGALRAKNGGALPQTGIILTSYALLRQDAELLAGICFEAVILDEAQNIKNPESQVAGCAFALRANFRLAITGTPIENRWEDLWSLFHFLMPELLGARKEFTQQMLCAQSDGRHLLKVKKCVRPFLLRRRKEEVALQLPEKFTQISWIEMTDPERALYEEWLQKNRSGVLKKVQIEGGSARRMEILEAILRLRQITCHPLLVDPDFQGESGKMERVFEDLEAAIFEGRKVVLYSQFAQMLHLIAHRIKEEGWPFSYLDGTTKDRETQVRKFQEEKEVQIFLISLKAGGVGLNLTAADYVFLFEPWWNDAVENQAIDRAHRIGRTGSVIARRYVTASSVEEKMMKLKEHKSSLAKEFLEGDNAEATWSLDDLCALLS